MTISSIAADIIGDANGDSKIDICDAVISLRYIAGWNTKININSADVNLDGVINILDTVYILQYLTDHDVELFEQSEEAISQQRLLNWKYTLDDENLIIQLNKYIGTEPNVHVPATFVINGIKYKTMVMSQRSIQRSTFDGNQILRSVFFEEGVMANEMSYMFKECPNLKYINRYPEYDGVWWLGVFVYCKNLVSAPKIPDNIEGIRIASFFSRCENLIGSYPIPENANKNYVSNIFFNCNNSNKTTNILWLGDSITAGTSTNSVSFVDYLRQDLKDVGIANAAVGGRTLCYGYDFDKTDIQASIVFDLDSFGILPEVDYVFVSAGTNDFAHRSSRRPYGTYRFADIGNIGDSSPHTLLGAFDTIVSTVKEKFPNATLVYTTPITRYNYDVEGAKATDTSVFTIHLRDFVDALREASEYYNVPYFDAYVESGMEVSKDSCDGTGDYFADKTHPTLAGQRKLADYFIEKLVSLYGFEKAE